MGPSGRDAAGRRFRRIGERLRALVRALSPRSAPGRKRLAAIVLIVLVAVVVAAVGTDLTPSVLEQWAHRAEWWFPAAFVLISGIVCVAPFPRTVFTAAAGVLFSPVLGVVLALSGAMLAAVLSFLAGRALGREAVRRRLTHPAVRSVDERLRRRGWLAVGSLRLIPVVPFSVLNYCASVSGVRLVPYLAATLVGSAPGTIAVVCFSDALASGPGWASAALSGVAVVAGLTGLAVDWWIDRRDRARPAASSSAAGIGAAAEAAGTQGGGIRTSSL